MDCAVRLTLAANSTAPTYTGGFWLSGVAQLTGGDRVTGWTSGILLSIGPVGERADVAQHGNYASQESADVSISANGYSEFLAAGATLENALVEIGTMSGSTFTVRWSGAVASPSWSGVEVALSVEPMGLRRHREIPAQVLTVTTTPTIAEGSEGKPVPIVYGAVERMTPPILESDRLPEVGIRIYSSSTEYVNSATTSLMLGNFTEGAIPDVVTSTTVTLFYHIATWGTGTAGNAGTWMETAVDGAIGGDTTHDIYVDVVSGTGSGQRRKITYVSRIIRNCNATTPYSYYEGATCTLLTPWDTLPDATSSFEIYKVDRLARYAVADQARTAIVSDRDSTLPLATDTVQIGTILVADVSNEFSSGEDVLSLEKLENSDVYGRTYLEDGITVTGTNQNCAGAGLWFESDTYYRFFEVACAGKVSYEALAQRRIEDLYLLGSADTTNAMVVSPHPYVFAYYRDFTGTAAMIANPLDASSALSRVNANAFSPSLADDGTSLNFRNDGFKLGENYPISSVKEIGFGLVCPQSYGVTTDEYIVINITKTTGSNTLVKNTGAAVTGGQRVAPARAPGVSILEIQLPDTSGPYGVKTTYGRFFRSGFWAEITSHTSTQIVVVDSSSWPAGTYDIVLPNPITTRSLGYVVEREVCLAASYGSVSLASTAVSVASGRRFGSPGMSAPSGFADGDPIIQARHAAVDLITRDLDQYGTSSASYSDLPADQIHMVIPSRVGSAGVLGQMCEEFNWIGSHDSVGREYFLPLFREGDDWTVTNAQVISGTFTGLGKTAVEDVITLPMVSRSWTQADGFRLVANVATLSADASAVNTSNIDQYAPGFDSPAQGVEAYGILRAALDRSGISQVGEIEYQWSSDIQSLLIDSGRLRWGALRKDVATFCVSDTHQAAWAILGRRVGITHRRYIKSERHGVIVARYWYPHLAQVQLTVFLDP